MHHLDQESVSGWLTYEEERRRAQALAEIDRAKTTYAGNIHPVGNLCARDFPRTGRLSCHTPNTVGESHVFDSTQALP